MTIITLKELSDKINEGVEKQEEGNKTLSSIDKGINKFFKEIERSRLDALEDSRENRKALLNLGKDSENRARGFVEATKNATNKTSSFIRDLPKYLAGFFARSLIGLTGIPATLRYIRNTIDMSLKTARGNQLIEAKGVKNTLEIEKRAQRVAAYEARLRQRAFEKDAKVAQQLRKKLERQGLTAEANKVALEEKRLRSAVETEKLNRKIANIEANKAGKSAQAAKQVTNINKAYVGYNKARLEAAQLENAKIENEKAKLNEKTAKQLEINNAKAKLRQFTSAQINNAGFNRNVDAKGTETFREVTKDGKPGKFASPKQVAAAVDLNSNTRPASPAPRGPSLGRPIIKSTVAKGLGVALRVAGSLPVLVLQLVVSPDQLGDGSISGQFQTDYNNWVRAMLDGKPKSKIIELHKKLKNPMYQNLVDFEPSLSTVLAMDADEIMSLTSMIYNKENNKIYTTSMENGKISSSGIGLLSSGGMGYNSLGELVSRGSITTGSELNALDAISEQNQRNGTNIMVNDNSVGDTNISNSKTGNGAGGTKTAPPARNDVQYW